MGRNRVTRILTAGAVAAVLASSVTSSPASGRGIRRVGRIAPGIVHKVIRQHRVPRVIHVVIGDVAGSASLRVALSNGSLPGLERTSSIARRHQAVAAVNGDFFRPSGRPVAAFATRGELVQTPLVWGANLAFGGGGRSAFMGHRDVSVELVSARSGSSVRVDRVNDGMPRRDQVKLYTNRGGMLVRPPRNACSARLKRTGPNRFGPGGSELVAPFTVREVHCRRTRMPLHDGVVVAARRRGRGSAAVKGLSHDRGQKLVWSLGWPNVGETIGGNPVLVRDGRLAWPNLRGPHQIFQPHPRTGVGIRTDGRVMLVTVDGRRPRYSKGMTLLGFARLMRSLGADWALNLDGGGSTTMVVKGAVVNRPSDGRERPVGSALMIVGSRSVHLRAAPPSASAAEPALEHVPSREPPAGDVDDLEMSYGPFPRRIAPEQDPASLGGLVSWLRAEDEHLPRSLLDVARRFDRLRAHEGR